MDKVQFAHKQWGDDKSLKAKRNIAYVELEACCPFTSYTLREIQWTYINLTKCFALKSRGQTYPLTRSCITALTDWLDGVWNLYSQTNLVMSGGVFCNNLIPEKMQNGIECLIQQLDMSDVDISDIDNAYRECRKEELRKQTEGRKAAKMRQQEREKAKREAALNTVVSSTVKAALPIKKPAFKASPSVERLFKKYISDIPAGEEVKKDLVHNPVAEQRLKEKKEQDTFFTKEYQYDTAITRNTFTLTGGFNQASGYRRSMCYDPSSTYYDSDAYRLANL